MLTLYYFHTILTKPALKKRVRVHTESIPFIANINYKIALHRASLVHISLKKYNDFIKLKIILKIVIVSKLS